MKHPAQAIQLFRFTLSGHSHRAELFLSLLGLPVEAVDVDLLGGQQKTPAYLAMNRFMDMLEVREGGIPAKSADATWNFCYEVTPPALHDVKRHKQWWDKTVNWEKFFWEE